MVKLLPLTVCIITNQFTAETDQVFKSLLPIAQQILVINTPGEKLTATDQRIEIISYPDQEINFSKWRNFAIKKATQQWMLFVDHDEIISKQLLSELPSLIYQQKYDGYRIRRIDYFLGQPLKHGEVGQVYKLRLAKTHRYHFIGSVHEVGQVVGLTQTINLPIYHYPHASIASFLDKISFYSHLSANNTHQTFSLLKLLLFPIAKFFVNYIIKLGILDGFSGLVYALLMSIHSLSVRIFTYESSQNH